MFQSQTAAVNFKIDNGKDGNIVIADIDSEEIKYIISTIRIIKTHNISGFIMLKRLRNLINSIVKKLLDSRKVELCAVIVTDCENAK